MQFLVIEGNIGSGKTTLAKMLAHDLNARLILEQFAENPFLPKFYQDPERYSFSLELSFLAERYRQIKNEVLNQDLNLPMIVSDYYFSKTAVFAQINLKPDEYHLFRQIFDMVADSAPKPDLYVYLNVETQNLLRNIKKRGREYEKDISPEYLDHISTAYFSYLSKITLFPVLIVDVNDIDFTNNNIHYQQLKNIIFSRKFNFGINRLNLT